MKLGDLIYYITKYTGIKFIVEKYHIFMGSKCNCDKRRKDLNDLKIKRWQNLIIKFFVCNIKRVYLNY